MRRAKTKSSTGEFVFCGPVDDPFFVDLGGIFDLGNIRPESARDALARKNVHTIAMSIPVMTLQKDNKNSYQAKTIVLAIGYSNTFAIEGLMLYLEPHKKALPDKQRIQLKNNDHKVTEGIYVAGTLAGWRSQLSIAAGSGAAVATDILTLWNNGISSQSHDSTKK